MLKAYPYKRRGVQRAMGEPQCPRDTSPCPAPPGLSQENISPTGWVRPNTVSPQRQRFGVPRRLVWGSYPLGCGGIMCWDCIRLLMGCLRKEPKARKRRVLGGLGKNKCGKMQEAGDKRRQVTCKLFANQHSCLSDHTVICQCNLPCLLIKLNF